MKLTKQQLEIYSKPGSLTNSKNMYKTLKNFFNNNLEAKTDIYLQGSYANHTNIRGDSDVDIILEFTSIFSHNINEFSQEEQEDFNNQYQDAEHSINYYKNQVRRLLNESNYTFIEKDKCFKITEGTAINADIVVCSSYKKFTEYPKCIEGILIPSNPKTISFPKLYKEKLSSKNTETNKNYKSMVRIFKNIFNYINTNSTEKYANLSSHIIESVLYNVPNDYFKDSNLLERFTSILDYLNSYENYSEMLTPDEQETVIGDNILIKIELQKFLEEIYGYM